MSTPEQRAELLALADKATPRPYDLSGSSDVVTPEGYICECDKECDAAYIIAACNLAPELAREVEELEQHCARLDLYITSWGDSAGTCTHCGNILRLGFACIYCGKDHSIEEE